MHVRDDDESNNQVANEGWTTGEGPRCVVAP